MAQPQTDAELIAAATEVWETAPSGPTADQCVTHHRACACREWAAASLAKALADALARANAREAALRAALEVRDANLE